MFNNVYFSFTKGLHRFLFSQLWTSVPGLGLGLNKNIIVFQVKETNEKLLTHNRWVQKKDTKIGKTSEEGKSVEYEM
jgi:hypothetical protein